MGGVSSDLLDYIGGFAVGFLLLLVLLTYINLSVSPLLVYCGQLPHTS